MRARSHIYSYCEEDCECTKHSHTHTPDSNNKHQLITHLGHSNWEVAVCSATTGGGILLTISLKVVTSCNILTSECMHYCERAAAARNVRVKCAMYIRALRTHI